MILPSGEIDQVFAIQSEGGYTIAYFFLCSRSGSFYGPSYFFQYFLYVLRKRHNVLVDGINASLLAFHEFSFTYVTLLQPLQFRASTSTPKADSKSQLRRAGCLPDISSATVH